MRFLKSDTGPGAGELNGFVDKGSHVHGELRFDAAFRIDGKVEGTIVSEGDLVIGDGGEVDGDIRVGQIFVSGTVRGTVRARRKIQLCSTARAYADLATPSLVIEDGATFEGRCSMNRETGDGDRDTGPDRDEPSGGASIQPLKSVKGGRDR